MKYIISLILAVGIVLAPVSAEATRGIPRTQYRCEPHVAATYGVCRLQYRRCVIVGFNGSRPIRHCTGWRYGPWSR